MGWVAIADLGHAPEDIPQRLVDRLTAAEHVLIPTDRGLAAAVLGALGVAFESYADQGMRPDAPADQVVEAVRSLAESGGVFLGVGGYPFMREGVVAGLLHRFGSVEILPAASPLEVLLLAFDVDMTADLDLIDASSLKSANPERGSHLIVTGMANPIAARSVSRRLEVIFPVNHPAAVATMRPDGACELRLGTVGSLEDAREVWDDTAVYVAPHHIKPPGGFPELVRIMAVLRAPDGCPWDLEQTHESLTPHLIEEAYEAVAAIDEGDMEGLADELGDILLQVVFHAQIAAEAGDFTIDDAVASIVAKLRRRHPHIFGDAAASTPDEVMHRWDSIKREEKPHLGTLDGVAQTLPALAYAQKLSRRAVSVGFEWESIDDVWEKVAEEIAELQAEEPGSKEAADEVGDLLFTVVNVARKMGIDAESALRTTCERFRRRFGHMEHLATEQGCDMKGMDAGDMEALWRLAKSAERGDAASVADDEGSQGT